VGMFLAVPLLSVVQIVCANIETTRPIAILISSGKSFRKNQKERKERRMRSGKKNAADPYDDFLFPDRQ